jgi:RsiW-degrading membrane proteinase PrsW (M82 family)
MILPEHGLNLASFQLHSEVISAKATDNLFYKSIAVFTEVNLIGGFFALLIMGIWTYYLRKLDFFRKEKISISLLVLVLGMLSTFLVFPISDFLKDFFNISFSSNPIYNLIVYSWLNIGLVEELVKILPVFILLYFTKEIDEPIDLVYYACLSALGFAFIENLLYFRNIGGQIFIGRAMYSVIGHMVDASFCVYGVILSKFKYKKMRYDLVILYFLLGSLIHALYDFFLFEGWMVLFYLSFLIFIQSWAIIINNCINNSQYFSFKILPKYERLKVFMAVSFSLLLILSFIADGLIVGKIHAVDTYWGSVFRFSLLIAFYVTGISSFDMMKGYWRKVDFSLFDDFNKSFSFRSLGRIFTNNTIHPQNRVGKLLKLHSPKSNVTLRATLDITAGKITDRVKLRRLNRSFDYDWFKVKLEQPLLLPAKYVGNEVYIQFESPYLSLEHDKNIKCHLRLLEIPEIGSKKYRMVNYGYIIANGHDFQYGVKGL